MNTSKLLITMTVLLVIFSIFPNCYSADYSGSFQLLDSPDGSTFYRLNIGISQSLQDYYLEKSHTLNSESDFANFVTPYALAPMADSLWEVYTDPEDFTNGVLMIVHQIPYEVTAPCKYPVETIVENKGDCDLFSLIAASIIKAGGLDVVLLYYESETHMNIGVSLPHVPHDTRGQAQYVTRDNVDYYVAECTGGNWETGWRVGECPDTLTGVSVQVITIENSEQWAPGQVSASYRTLSASALSLSVSPTYAIQGSTITVSGQLSPAFQNSDITVYIKANNAPWAVLGTTTTDSEGIFTLAWNADYAGICYIRASWSGDDTHTATDSQTQAITVLSTFFVLLLGLTVILVCVGVVIYAASKRASQGNLEPQPPAIPY